MVLSHNHTHTGACHDHSHGHAGHGEGSDGVRLLIAFVIIAGFMVVEIIGGIISGSLALLADAGHMATDAAALLLALSARWLATRNARQDVFPFGLRRAQVLAGFLNAVALIALTGWLIYEAINRFFEPHAILTGHMLVVAVAGLGANIAAFFVLHGGSGEDLNMRGALLHVIGDIFGSVAAIASAIIIGATGFVRIDPVLTLLVSALIMRAAWPLLTEASHILLQGAPANLDPDKLAERLKSEVDGVTGVHQIKSWMLTPEEPQLAMHLCISDPAVAQDTLTRVKKLLQDEFGIAQSTIQIEYDDSCPDAALAEEAGTAQGGKAEGGSVAGQHREKDVTGDTARSRAPSHGVEADLPAGIP